MSLWNIKYLDKVIEVNVSSEIEERVERWKVDKEKYYTQLIKDQIEVSYEDC